MYFYNDYIVLIFTFVGIFSLYMTEWNLPCINKVIYLSIYLSSFSVSTHKGVARGGRGPGFP